MNKALFILILIVLISCINHPSIKRVQHPDLPKPIGPYSHSVSYKDFIFLSGQIGIDPKTSLLRDGIEAQTVQIFKNISSILKDNATDIDHITKTTIFLQNLKDYEKINKIYGSYFKDHFPARSTIEVSALPGGALIEIECIAVIKTP